MKDDEKNREELIAELTDMRRRAARLEEGLSKAEPAEALRRSEELFRSFFESAVSGMAIINLDGRPFRINDSLCRLFGYSREEMLQQGFLQVTHPDEVEQSRAFYHRILSGEVDKADHERRFVRKDGVVFWARVRGTWLRDSNRQPIYWVTVLEDITERKRAEEELRKLDQLKNEFISVAAHELNTPLTAMIGYAELLLDAALHGGSSPEQQTEFLREIHEQAQALAGLVADVLDIGRIEAGQEIPLALEPCSIGDALRRAVVRYRHLATGHEIELEVAAAVAEPFHFDRFKIDQVLENLLSNAVKYSPGRGRIRIMGAREGEGYHVSVADEGIGMTPEQTEKVFEKFFRADSSATAVSGLGLGMGIARNVIERHGGRIWVESALGKGTTVHFTLPADNGAGVAR